MKGFMVVMKGERKNGFYALQCVVVYKKIDFL